MPWQKGQSGNPNGRRKGPTIPDELWKLFENRENGEPIRTRAAKRLIDIWLYSPDEAAAIKAAKLIMEHTSGKPLEQVSLDVNTQQQPMRIKLVWGEDEGQTASSSGP